MPGEMWPTILVHWKAPITLVNCKLSSTKGGSLDVEGVLERVGGEKHSSLVGNMGDPIHQVGPPH